MGGGGGGGGGSRKTEREEAGEESEREMARKTKERREVEKGVIQCQLKMISLPRKPTCTPTRLSEVSLVLLVKQF